MTSMVTTDELASYVGRPIESDDASALLALELATAAVQDYCAQTLFLVEDEEIYAPGSGTRVVLLPEAPVSAVTALEVDGEVLDPTLYDWAADGVLTRLRGIWPLGGRRIVVTYTHGYDPIPTAIKAVVLSVAARVLDSPAAVRQETIGAYSVTYTNGAPTLLDSETAALAKYKVR
jgi:hypothetical protein